MTESEVHPRSQKRILIVDDSALVRLYYHDALIKEGFEVEQAANGMEGLEAALSTSFDLVIVDVNMPTMDGLSFVRNLRREAGELASLPALVISTESKEQDMQDARRAGANFYLVKPVTEEALLMHVAALSGTPR